MITKKQSKTEVSNASGQFMPDFSYYGLSTDEKPMGAMNGEYFFEMNTSKTYVFDAQNATWREI